MAFIKISRVFLPSLILLGSVALIAINIATQSMLFSHDNFLIDDHDHTVQKEEIKNTGEKADTIDISTSSKFGKEIAGVEKKSFAASKLERMAMYKERYKYQPAKPYTNQTARDLLCGVSPNYTQFFTHPGRNRNSIRSDVLNSEDKNIYELFFKEDTNDGISPIKGTVVEMGAYNGLQESNSHFYDICLGWETLLVEGNPLMWENLVENRPHAHRFSYAPSCSEKDDILNKTVKFDRYPMINSGLNDGFVTTTYTARYNSIEVPCGSLTKVLLDVLGGHVSFFSLDVEGSEPFVVQNIEFDKVFIEIMMVETFNNICQHRKPCKSRDQFRTFMLNAGYIMFERMIRKSDVFIHPLSNHLKTAKEKGYRPSLWTVPKIV